MRKLLIALVLAAGVTAYSTPPPYETGPDFGPDPGTSEAPQLGEAWQCHRGPNWEPICGPVVP
jgi:hypothetical protein